MQRLYRKSSWRLRFHRNDRFAQMHTGVRPIHAGRPRLIPSSSAGVRTAAFGDSATDFDPLPPLNTVPQWQGYPRMAAAPANGYPPASYPPDQNPPGSYSPGNYLPGPAASQPMLAAPPGDAYPMPGPAIRAAPWQQPPTGSGEFAPPDYYLQDDAPVVSGGTNSAARLLDHLEWDGVVRGFYRNDQRIRWSGMEETFGAEADLTPRLRYRAGEFEFVVDTEFWINQPYERNPLEIRRSGSPTPPISSSIQFAVGKLALVTNYCDWTFKIGKFETPFGRAYYPIYTNPYLSTDNSGWTSPSFARRSSRSRETGILAHYKSGYFVGDIALTNGGGNLDTNSSKAFVGRRRAGVRQLGHWRVREEGRRRRLGDHQGVRQLLRL